MSTTKLHTHTKQQANYHIIKLLSINKGFFGEGDKEKNVQVTGAAIASCSKRRL